MVKKKRMMSLLFSSALLLSACGGNGGAEEGSGPVAEKNADGKYDPVLEITTAKQLDENAGKYDSGDDINNNPMIALGEEKLGIKMNTILLGGDAGNYDTKLRLGLTGSEELPDVFPVYSTQMIADMIESGRVKAIDEDIEQYMPERLKEVYDQYPETFSPVTKDGKTYGIANTPVLDDGQVLIIRQDWLDELGLEAPTNLEEFEQVIKAFTEEDPDGNGKKDTYGFTYSGSSIYNTGWVSDPVTLFSANSGKFFPGTWQEDENGELSYGSIHEGNRETLEKMADWHKNGWLFKEAAATGAWDAMTEFTEGKAGMFIGRPWAIDSVNDLIVTNENARIEAYPTLRQENGDPSYQNGATNDGWIMFNSDFDNMEAFFEYYDWLYDIAFGTGDFQYGYLQDYDWDEVNGEIVFDPAAFDPAKETPFAPDKAIFTKNRPYVDRMKPAYDVAVEGKVAETGDELKAEEKMELNLPVITGTAIAYEHREELLPNLFNGEPTETMKRNWEQLQTLEAQTYTNIIYGKEDISAFDDFVQKWNEQGGEDITKEVNEWYQNLNN